MVQLNSLLVGALLSSCISGAQYDAIKSLNKVKDSVYLFTSNNQQQLKVSWLQDDIIRIEGIPSNSTFEELKTKITVTDKFNTPNVYVNNNYNEYEIVNSKTNYKLIVNKKPLKLKLKTNANSVIFEEVEPINLDEKVGTNQTLKLQENEHFFGGGMQNGRFSHRNSRINITADFTFEDGSNPNPVPFYMSSKGYGVFRNTFKPGQYNFFNPTILNHIENRFDAYFFLGDFKNILDKYTYLTGRPFLPPIFGLQMGDSDCYNNTAEGKPKRDTLIDSNKIAEGYIEHDIPLGYMLINDGFNCGYTRLNETSNNLNSKNISLGLWTNSDLSQQPTEVGQNNALIYKLDGTWVGPGYELSFNACNEALDGIHKYSNKRGLVWSIEGWAGVQRCGVHWSGDQFGTFDNIKFHIPTIHGSGLSSLVYTANDLDGIVGGSNITYIRDIQFKSFSPAFMGVSGWAETDRQPWRYGEPGTSINRKYLKLRTQLLPYIYNLAYEAHKTGFPIARSMVLEFPNDPKTWDKDLTKYQYMFGSSFLVAPVYKDELKRDGIYLPKGNWIDYWNGKVYQGPTTLDNYPAPLDTLPLFVKENSIIPMWNNVNSHKERTPSSPIILDVYPSLNGQATYKLYEDDLTTRQYQNDKFSTQMFYLKSVNGNISFKIGKVIGDFDGVAKNRSYILKIHNISAKKVTLGNNVELNSLSNVNFRSTFNQQGYFLEDKTLNITIDPLKADSELEVNIQV